MKKTKRGLSDSNLQMHWRRCVRAIFGNRCFFCGASDEIEVHHIVKRKTLLLRHDYRNGILVCKYGCHQHAETPVGKHKIDAYLTSKGYLEYLQLRTGNCKDYFVQHGITRDDFLQSMLDELRKVTENVGLGE